jgi:hypothetical protein
MRWIAKRCRRSHRRSPTSHHQASPWSSALALSHWRECPELRFISGLPPQGLQLSAMGARQHPQQGPLLSGSGCGGGGGGSGGGSGATRPAKCCRSTSTRWAASRPWASMKELRSIPRAAAAPSNSSKIWAARGSYGETQRSSAHEFTVSGSRWILGVLSSVKRDTQAALTGPALNRIRSSRLQIVLTSPSENSISGPWAMSLNGCS